jgi:hypothetical protein
MSMTLPTTLSLHSDVCLSNRFCINQFQYDLSIFLPIWVLRPKLCPILRLSLRFPTMPTGSFFLSPCYGLTMLIVARGVLALD